MQPRGRAGHGLTYDATNIEECGQVPSLLGSKVNCGKQKHGSDLGAQGRPLRGHRQKRSCRAPDPLSLRPLSEEVGGGLWGSDWPKSPVSLQQTLPSPQSYTALSPSEMALTSQPETTENWPLRALSLWGTTAFSEPQPIQPHSGSAPDGTEGPLQERFTEISL